MGQRFELVTCIVEGGRPNLNASVLAARNVVIETARLRLREADERDIDGLERLFTDPEVMQHYAQVARPGAGAKWLAAVRRLRAVRGYAPWTVELHDGTFVGQCGPLPQVIDGRPEIEMIFFFARAFWRGDFAKEAGEACLRIAFGPMRLARIIAVMYPENRPAVRLALRCGLRFERSVDEDGRTMLLYAIENPAP